MRAANISVPEHMRCAFFQSKIGHGRLRYGRREHGIGGACSSIIAFCDFYDAESDADSECVHKSDRLGCVFVCVCVCVCV